MVEHATENCGVASSILALGTLGLSKEGFHIKADFAGVVQLVERLLAKEKVVGSSPIARSNTSQAAGKKNVRAALFYGDVAKLARQGSAKP